MIANGIQSGPNWNAWSEQDCEKLLELERQGLTQRQIAEQMGTTKEAVNSIRQRMRTKAKKATKSLLATHLGLNRSDEADQAWKSVTCVDAGLNLRTERGKQAARSIRTLEADLQILRLLTPKERIGFLQAAADFIDQLKREEVTV